MSQPHDFPFDITDVAELLHLRIRRPSPQGLYVDCPICNDKRGKMHINTQTDTWRCNYCDESGGMLALYAKVHSISTSTAYREISDALLNGVNLSDHAVKYPDKPKETPVEAAPAADIAVRNKTYTALLAMLTLSKEHRAHLQTVRGLPDEQIERLGYKSMPPFYMCRSLANRLLQNGHQLDGVPGFYQKDGQWTIASSTYTAGIMIPARTRQGLISGFQIRLDVPLKNEDDPPEKDGAKYIWFSSSSKNMGVTSGSSVHFIGNPSARVVYVIEGLLKADISHCLTNRTFAAIAGANNTSQLDTLFALLAQNGTEEIIEAHDMDKYSNQMTSNGASKIYLMARKNGMACRRLTWNPNYKGFDDWQLALREKEQKEKEVQRMNFKQQYLCGKCDFTYIDGCVELWHTRAEKDLDLTEYLGLTKEEYQIFLAQGNRALKDILDSQRVFRRFCIYQLCLGETQTVPFAFKQLDALRKAGYEQPPAAAYQTVWSAEVCCPKGQNDMEVLGRLFLDFNEHLPEDYRGRPLAPSDVVELDCQGKRTYFYVNDCRDFAPVRFSPFLCKRLPEPAQKQE